MKNKKIRRKKDDLYQRYFKNAIFVLFVFTLFIFLMDSISAELNYTTGEAVYGTLADGVADYNSSNKDYGGIGFYYSTILISHLFPNINPGNSATDLIFKLYSGSSLTEVLTLKSDGNVGIGTTSPTQKLEVTGNLNVTGNIYVGGCIVYNSTGTPVTLGTCI